MGFNEDAILAMVKNNCAYEEQKLELLRVIKKLSDRLNRAEQCICDIEDALDRGNDNDWAREAIERYENERLKERF